MTDIDNKCPINVRYNRERNYLRREGAGKTTKYLINVGGYRTR